MWNNSPLNSSSIGEDPEFLSPLFHLGDPWSPLYQEILELPIDNGDSYNINEANSGLVSTFEQQHFATPQEGLVLDKGLDELVNSNSEERRTNAGTIDTENGEDGSSDAKKLDHNAKERIRRMKISEAFLSLRSLLPNSKRSKKRWSAPTIVDKALKYIPQLQNEIDALESKKENIVQSVEKNKSIVNSNDQTPTTSQFRQNRTVSVHQVNKWEAIVQICMGNDEDGLAFTGLLQRLEDDEEICIKSASSVYVCESKTCYHLHIQIINQIRPNGANITAELRDRLLS